MSTEEIVAMLIQSVTLGGNVLLNVGPRGDAQLDPPQVDRLLGLGAWLEAQGQYVQDTRPVALPASKVAGVRIGAVETTDDVVVHLLEAPEEQHVRIALPEGVTGGAPRLIGGVQGDARLHDGYLVLSPSEWPDAPTQIVVIPKRG